MYGLPDTCYWHSQVDFLKLNHKCQNHVAYFLHNAIQSFHNATLEYLLKEAPQPKYLDPKCTADPLMLYIL